MMKICFEKSVKDKDIGTEINIGAKKYSENKEEQK